jgi:hypothetical protein
MILLATNYTTDALLTAAIDAYLADTEVATYVRKGTYGLGRKCDRTDFFINTLHHQTTNLYQDSQPFPGFADATSGIEKFVAPTIYGVFISTPVPGEAADPAIEDIILNESTDGQPNIILAAIAPLDKTTNIVVPITVTPGHTLSSYDASIDLYDSTDITDSFNYQAHGTALPSSITFTLEDFGQHATREIAGDIKVLIDISDHL